MSIDIAERCRIASEIHPNGWPIEVIYTCPSLPRRAKNSQKSLIDALIETKLSPSKGQARNSIKSNAVMINRIKCKDADYILSNKDILNNLNAIVIENGRRNFGIIEMV